MASDPIAQENEVVPETQVPRRPPRRPFYKDPLSIISWSIALASIVAYWYFFVRKPVPQPGQQIARLTAVEGAVKLKPNATEGWKDARLSDLLRVGDVVQTFTRSGAQISFNSGNVVTVRPDSVVYIGGSAESSTAAWRVQTGRVNFSVAQEQTEIVTPTVKTTALQNAAGNIDVADTGETGVKIFRGQAEVETTQGQRITLGENQAVQVDAAGKGRREARPPAAARPRRARRARPARARGAPRLVGGPELDRRRQRRHVPRRGRLQRDAGEPPPLRRARASGHRGHDALAQRPRGRPLLLARRRGQPRGARGRVLAHRVLLRDRAGDAEPPPPAASGPLLVLQAVEQVAPGIVHVGGRTDPGGTVEVGGAAVRVLPDGSFSEYVRHEGGGDVVVRATAPGGAVTEQSRPPARK